ncbi:unnamed protein product, partial [Cuscuta campestris]
MPFKSPFVIVSIVNANDDSPALLTMTLWHGNDVSTAPPRMTSLTLVADIPR